MDSDYICKHLLSLANLFYGEKNKCFAKVKKGDYVFGSKKLNTENKVTKQVAIYLIIGKINDNS